MKRYKRLVGYHLLLTLVCFSVFVFFYSQYKTRSRDLQMQRHARVIDENVWKLDFEGTAGYLSLASERDSYEAIAIQGIPTGELFVVEGSELTGLNQIMGHFGLLPVTPIETDVKHNGQVIARLTARHRSMNIYVYLYAFLVFSLICIVAILFSKTVYAKRQVEEKVKQRTAKLAESNERLIAGEQQLRASNQALMQSEKKYRSLLENLPQRIFYKDTDSVYVSCNKHYADDLGITPEEIVGKTDFEFHPKELAEKYRADDKRLMESRQTEELEEAYMQDGKEIIILTVKTPVIDNGGNVIGIQGIFRDITERKRAEEALSRHSKILNETQHIARLGGWEYDVVNQRNFWTDELYRIIGVSSDFDIDDLSEVAEFFHPDDREKMLQAFQASIEDRKPFDLECRFINSDNEELWVRDVGQPVVEDDKVVKVWGILQDITERKRAEEVLRKKDENYRVLVEGTDSLVTRVDKDGKFLFVNQTSERVFGLKPGEAIGLLAFDFIHPDDRQVTIEAFNGWLRDKVQSVTLENRQISKTGQVYDVLWTCKLIYDDSGQFVWIDGVAQDITERKKAEAEIQAKGQQLQASNQQLRANEQEREKLLKTVTAKNRELQSVVYIASHDLKSPLVNMQGFSTVLEKSYRQIREILNSLDLDDEVARQIQPLTEEDIPEALKFISASAVKMKTLLDGLLQVSRVGTVEMAITELDMNQVIKDVCEAMEFQVHEAGAEISVDNLGVCLGDANMINQLFSNLVSNSIKYLDPKRKGKIHISSRLDGDKVIYCVEDNGIGIDDAHQSKVFELFHRLNPEDDVEGEGLGLTIVTRILDRNNGSIWVESEPGKGSKFFVVLPAC